MNFPSQILFNDINHGYKTAILKESYLWLLPCYMAVAFYCYYKKVSRTMQLQLYHTSLTDDSDEDKKSKRSKEVCHKTKT